MMDSNLKKERVERRNLLAQLFVVLLLGLAYQEMVNPVRDSVRQSGITWGTAVLFGIFFLTSLRFFIGAQLHLVDQGLLQTKGGIWFYDFFVIVFEMVIFIFLGGVSSPETSRIAAIDFVQLLMFIYLLDVTWIASQWLFGKLVKSWRRPFIPWGWAIVNLVALTIMAIIYYTSSDPFSVRRLVWIGAVNSLAFVVDVLLLDYFNVV